MPGAPLTEPFANRPDARGVIALGVESCEIDTEFEQRAKKENALGHVFLTQWTRDRDVPYWVMETPRGGRYMVEVSYSARRAGGAFTVEAGGAKLEGKAESTGGDWVFRTQRLGEIELRPGRSEVRVKIAPAAGTMNLERVVLRPVG